MIFSIIFPFHCYVCDEIVYTEGLCVECWKRVELLSGPRCSRCCFRFLYNIDGLCAKCVNETTSFLDKLITCAEYNTHTKVMIMKLKNYGHTEIADFFLPFLMREMKDVQIDCMVPVPLHWLKQIWRGYNQAAVIAKAISDELGKSYLPYGLKCIKFRWSSPAKLKDRQKRAKQSFVATQTFRGMHVALVDDVYTTGATLEECAKALKMAGAARVIGVTLCKR